MSPIGRIFLVLNLVLSAIFLGFASNVLSTQEDYKSQLEDAIAQAETDKAAAEEEIADLTTQLNAAQSESSSLRQERDQNALRADRAESNLEQEQSENARLRESVEANAQKLADYNTKLDGLLADNKRTAEELRAAIAERDEARVEARDAQRAQRDAEDALAAANAQIAELEVALRTAQVNVQSLEAQIERLMADTNLSLNDYEGVPRIEASVLGVRDDLDLVALNVGSSDGVKRGMTFQVFRGVDYKGSVRVENVESGQCSAVITRPSQTAPISAGDRATTQL